MHRTFLIPALALVTGLSACNGTLGGGTDLERAAVGGVVGCAAGEIIDDGSCIAGAGIGAAAGALSN